MGLACVREDECVKRELAGTDGVGVTDRGRRACCEKPSMGTSRVRVKEERCGRRRGEGRKLEMATT